MLFYRSSSCRANNGQSSISRKRPDDTSLEIEMERMRNSAYWFELRLAQNKGLEFWQTINNATDCLVKVVRRLMDDTDAGILFGKNKNKLKTVRFIA